MMIIQIILGLTKEQKEQLDLLTKFHKESLLSDEDYEKQKQSIIDGSFMVADENEPIYLLHMDHETDHEAKAQPSSDQGEANQKLPEDSNGKASTIHEEVKKEEVKSEPVDVKQTDIKQEVKPEVTMTAEPTVVEPLSISSVSSGAVEEPKVASSSVEVVKEKDNPPTKTIGVVNKNMDLDILDIKPVDVSVNYLENYGFEIADDEDQLKLLKPLFDSHKEFNETKISRQKNRWKEFIAKHKIGPNGFTTLEEYEQQRIFHFIEESNEFKKLVRKGIPMEYRAVMWYIIR